MARVVSNSIDEGKTSCFHYHLASLGVYLVITILSLLIRKYDRVLEERALAKINDDEHLHVQ